MPNMFGFMDDILVIGYNEDGADHDAAVHKVLQWCKEVSLKLNKENVILDAHPYCSLERLYLEKESSQIHKRSRC